VAKLIPSRIFISYRREDAAGDAGRLADHLNARFGESRVFLDVETIQPGSDFMQVLRESLQQTAAMLVIIGPRWTSVLAHDGTRRLDNPEDVVRLEVEGALGRGIPVVPVLVEGASLPQPDDLPSSLRPLLGRQAAAIDLAEFHGDAQRLCNLLSTLVERDKPRLPAMLRSWRAAAALVALVALGVGGYRLFSEDRRSAAARTRTDIPVIPTRTTDVTSVSTENANAATADQAERTRRAKDLLDEASTQLRRNQYSDALATLARARDLAPTSESIKRAEENVAMTWIRRMQGNNGKFGEAIKPALSVIDGALPAATGERRADLLAHSGWATFLLWRDGDRQLEPADWYTQALAIDSMNPYANAMLAHWILFTGDDVTRAAMLFANALRSGRAVEDVRALQWAAYGNSSSPLAAAERVRLADDMRRRGETLSGRNAQALWSSYYFALPNWRQKDRQTLLDAVPPDDHISTLNWAFGSDDDQAHRMTVRYYTSLLDAAAGRTDKAIADLRALLREIGNNSGSLRDAVQAALERLSPTKH
jgi:hypothetical protein